MATTWTREERSAIMRFSFDDGSFYEQRVVEQLLDPGNDASAKFYLYYFVKDQTYENKDKPTILFAAGGPGQMIMPDTENFADMYGYRTVYFHLRGTGLSQLPDNADADRYLRTAYVVEDIEKIRDDLGIKQWFAVMGHSYGAVVVQWYAHEHPRSVEKVILSAPMAPMSLLNSGNGKKGSGEVLTFESLRKIYKTKPFRFLGIDPDGGGIRKYLVDRAQQISQEVEDRFGSVQFVGDNYHDSKLNEELRRVKLDYGQSFFGAIRRLRHVGWMPLDVPYTKPISTPKVDDTQVQCGLIIARAILKREKGFELEKVFEKGDILTDKISDGERLLGRRSTQNTSRPYYLISIYDGLSEALLKSLKAGGKFASGEFEGSTFNHPMTRLIRALDPEKPPKAWDPKEKTHDKPTLILKGGADPVTEQRQAEHYFEKALSSKEKILVEFPGVGHSMALPDLDPSDRPLLKIPIKVRHASDKDEASRILSPRDKLIDEFLKVKSVADFEKAKFVEALRKAFTKSFAELDQGVADENEPRNVVVRTGYSMARNL